MPGLVVLFLAVAFGLVALLKPRAAALA